MKKILVLLLICCQAPLVMADETNASDAIEIVTVRALRHPELKSYTSILAGLRRFDEMHGLAPAVPAPRFRLRANWHQDYGYFKGLRLRLRDANQKLEITVAPDGSFSIPTEPATWGPDAELVLDSEQGLLHGEPDLRSPGLPVNQQRLGDLRLECEVAIAITRADMNLFKRAAISTFLLTGHWCRSARIDYLSLAPAPVTAVTLVDGERRESLPASAIKGRYFKAPLFANNWPDSTLIEFQFGPNHDATADSFAREPLFVRGSMNGWGVDAPLRHVGAARYVTEITLPKGKHLLKVGSLDFRTIDLGAPLGERALAPGARALLTRGGLNVGVAIDRPGIYQFTLDVGEPDQPVLEMTAATTPANGGNQ